VEVAAQIEKEKEAVLIEAREKAVSFSLLILVLCH
jgi:hypothetical protein